MEPSTPTGRHDATRYLCVAAQIDPQFNATLLKVMSERRRAIASSPEVDLVTVLKYGLAARRRQLGRDACLAAILLLFLLLLPSLGVVALLWGAVLGWLVVYGEKLWTFYRVLAPGLRRDVFDPARAPAPNARADAARLTEIRGQTRGNLTVFPLYRPFVGYGGTIRAWSLTLNVATPGEGRTVEPFTVHELYAHMATAAGEIGLPGTAVENRLFVNGNDLLHQLEPAHVRDAVLPDRFAAPAPGVPDGVLSWLRDNPHQRTRPYLVVRLPGWHGELVVTLFLRFTLLPRRDLLHVEASASLLAPVRERYRVVDRLLGQPTPRQILRLAPGPAATLGGMVSSVPRLLAAAFEPLAENSKRREEERAIKDRTFNYGASVTPREAASDNLYYRYFQEQDVEMYDGLIERRIWDALVDFLDEHGVDVSELKERRTTILNNGVYITGQGSLTARSVAAGTGARSVAMNSVNRLAGRVGGAGGGPGGGTGGTTSGGGRS
ncbi:hypothetical protein [Streptomyces sp. 6N223]|uniref:hypothetical protein n=1 Tax=Streptomyces sp. 6N223 TaxID=3457412 RepID=UPI003FD1CFD4